MVLIKRLRFNKISNEVECSCILMNTLEKRHCLDRSLSASMNFAKWKLFTDTESSLIMGFDYGINYLPSSLHIEMNSCSCIVSVDLLTNICSSVKLKSLTLEPIAEQQLQILTLMT